MNSGWIATALGSFNPAGEQTVAEFCLDGPAVVEVSALISVFPANTKTKMTLSVDEGMGLVVKTFSITADADLDDMIDVYWMGKISTDALIVIFLEGQS